MRNFYEMAVKDKLLKYTYAKEFLARIDNDIMCLKNKEKNKNMIGKYGISSGAGGSLSQEEIILNINAEIDLLEKNRQSNIDLIKRMDKAMEGMSELEKDITLEIYGKKKRDGRIETLKSKYHYSQSQIYRIANDGVRHISLMLYGNC
ncbi:hypothetical protein K8P03_05095 [Anaerococcus murdochii]|uniref:Phage transcriptional regulator, RinA family n=1 Tax=Anaerococcus murdochii TaxID=411577 RepID=A0ABS7SYR0_9FIRM|nr:hypothetical protein [Anaerococcus murdochii]MBZ2386674.1 hypothetical protein [Anaerococcus murdochii]